MRSLSPFCVQISNHTPHGPNGALYEILLARVPMSLSEFCSIYFPPSRVRRWKVECKSRSVLALFTLLSSTPFLTTPCYIQLVFLSANANFFSYHVRRLLIPFFPSSLPRSRSEDPPPLPKNVRFLPLCILTRQRSFVVSDDD